MGGEMPHREPPDLSVRGTQDGHRTAELTLEGVSRHGQWQAELGTGQRDGVDRRPGPAKSRQSGTTPQLDVVRVGAQRQHLIEYADVHIHPG